MELLNLDSNNETGYNTAIALGNFDGVHVGHQSLIKKMIEMSDELNLTPSVLLFNNHTRSHLDGKGPALLTSSEQKIDIFSRLGVKKIFNINFNDSIMKLTPEDFFIEILIKKLKVKAIIVGYNYTFGYKASGNSATLKELGDRFGVSVEILDPVYIDGEIVSSTGIRDYLKEGRLDKVKDFLGRDYSICGKVVTGKRIGKKLGFPTANIQTPINYVIPKTGVYATETLVNDRKYLSATSVGYNPTFEEDSIKIESHIIDFDQDIYSETVQVIFKRYLRDEIKFNNMEDLKQQILEDIIQVKAI